jgi:hypothetical protein
METKTIKKGDTVWASISQGLGYPFVYRGVVESIPDRDSSRYGVRHDNGMVYSVQQCGVTTEQPKKLY